MAHTIVSGPMNSRTVVRTSEAMRADDLGKLVLRLTIAALILLHGISKINGGVGAIAGMLQQHGMPPALAYGAYIGEVLAPVLVIIGVLTRPAALVMAINMIVAVSLAHMGQLGDLNKQGGWALELQACFLFGSLAIALLGAGGLSVGGRSRWN